jgi:deoxyribonuclease V
MSNSNFSFTSYDLKIIKRFPWTKSLIKKQYEQKHFVKESPVEPFIQTLLTIATLERKDQIIAGGILYDWNLRQYDPILSGQILECKYPYIPSLLSLRNRKPLLDVIKRFLGKFDLLLVEGAGIQHPRFFGLACQIGVELDLPTIGITKKGLCGTVDFGQSVMVGNLEFTSLEIHPVHYVGEEVAYFIRKKGNLKGVYISIGHRVSLPGLLPKIIPFFVHRIPEPLRLIKGHLKKLMRDEI